MQPVSVNMSSAEAASQPQPRLVHAAHEFESQLMTELMKPLTRASSPDGEDDDSGSAGALEEFASEALGKAVSEQGGLGIASRIIHDLSHAGNQKVSAPVT